MLAIIPSIGRFSTKGGYGKYRLRDAFDDTSHFCDLKPCEMFENWTKIKISISNFERKYEILSQKY